MNTHMAAEPTVPTESDASSETNGHGNDINSQAGSPVPSKKEKRNRSESKRRNNIKEQFLRLKDMIPSVKDVEKIETKHEEMLAAFDWEASEQVTRRAMLLQQIADIQQAINNAGNKGGKNTPLPQGPWIETAANTAIHLPPGF